MPRKPKDPSAPAKPKATVAPREKLSRTAKDSPKPAAVTPAPAKKAKKAVAKTAKGAKAVAKAGDKKAAHPTYASMIKAAVKADADSRKGTYVI